MNPVKATDPPLEDDAADFSCLQYGNTAYGGHRRPAAPFGGSPRLALIASLVPRGGRVVDIGTDHARIPIELLKKGVVAVALATDLAAKPLSAARRQAEKAGIDPGQISFLQTDGLDGIALTPVDTVIISGLGGKTVARILRDHLEGARAVRRLLLQPQTHDEVLRRFLFENGLAPDDELTVSDRGHVYLVMVSDPMTPPRATPSPSPVDLAFGFHFLNKAREAHRLLFEGAPFRAEHFLLTFEARAHAESLSDDAVSCLILLFRKTRRLAKQSPFDPDAAAMLRALERRMNCEDV